MVAALAELLARTVSMALDATFAVFVIEPGAWGLILIEGWRCPRC